MSVAPRRAAPDPAAPRVPLRGVAALFLERQHLARPRARRLTPSRLVKFVTAVGGLQLDSINVIERAHYLTLFSRFGPYDRAALDRMVYRRRLLFDYWAHAACLVPRGDFPQWRRAMLDYSTRSRGWAGWLRRNRAMLDRVEAEIRERGPLGNADFAHPGGKRGQGWWDWKPSAHALDFLWMSGRTMIRSREHFHKRFDLTERVLPETATVTPPDTAAFRRWHIRRSLQAMGAATEVDLGKYLTFPRAGPGEKRAALAAMLRDGEVVEVVVTPAGGPGRWYALAEDVPALERAGRRRAASRGTTFLAPFDSFLWHRERTRRLFGFDYTIEVYVPSHKRVHGYYSLPILHDGQLIGRVDVKNHRAERRLELRHVHLERWVVEGGEPPAAAWGRVDRDATLAGIADAARALAEFTESERIVLGRTTPAALARNLAQRLG